eukprot:CAMPEP_0179076800 /NCGR_PEP_ID=MMETSP0796-20121207/34287_1 /TAXON_ID=73915 /ORGANISM="Pyrodinium bahamense, Strain pbaha01" /LENGTH=47 /DNA_ID= /DNA_START= /DNA_END= /DNA_ORIENTATION=
MTQLHGPPPEEKLLPSRSSACLFTMVSRVDAMLIIATCAVLPTLPVV